MTKPATAWMPLYIGDYLADTRHLSAAEHGAYLLMIMQYWTSGPLLDDDTTLARISCTTAEEWGQIGPIVRRFFRARGGQLHHKRIDAERARVENVRKKRVISGKKGGEAKAEKTQTHQRAASTCQDFASDLPAISHVQSQSQSPSTTPSSTIHRESPAREPVLAMPAVTDPAHRWAGLADGEEIDEKMVRRPTCGGFYLDLVCQDIAQLLGINDPRWRTDWRPVVAWLKDGFKPSVIYPAIREVVGRPSYTPGNIRSLAYFDQAVRGYRRAA